MYRVLFVCMGNICRSPAAEGVFRHWVESDGLGDQVLCDSAGTIDFHQGSSPDSRIQRTGLERGYEIRGAARQVTRQDLESFDMILAMDRENLEYLRDMDPGAQHREKIVSFCDFLRESDAEEVPDPYYGGQQGFERVFDLLEDGCQALLGVVRQRVK